MQIDVRCVYTNAIECPVLRRLGKHIRELVPNDVGNITELEIAMKSYSILSSFCSSCVLISSFKPGAEEELVHEVKTKSRLEEVLNIVRDKYGDIVDVIDLGDKIYVVPKKKWIGEPWRDIHNLLKSVGFRWVKASQPEDSQWEYERKSVLGEVG